jgi:hypothetical protein
MGAVVSDVIENIVPPVTITAPRNPSVQSNPTSYVERQISVTITLGEGTFGQTGKNTVTLENLRVAATISNTGYPAQGTADIRIYGVTESIMNQLITLQVLQTMVRANNTVLVKAGDKTNGMSVVFFGYTTSTWKNLDGAPETFLNITAYSSALGAVVPSPPSSFPGTADVGQIMSGLAKLLGTSFENDGVNVKVSNAYLCGSALQQAEALARMANINMTQDLHSNPPTLAIWPRNATRGGIVPLISPTSGLVLYPTYQDLRIRFRCLFNPNIALGGQIKMDTTSGGPQPPPSQSATLQQLRDAGPNGYWYVNTPLVHDLSAQIPDGPWFTDVQGTRGPGLPSPPL